MFNLEEYRAKSEKPKLRYFFEYLDEKFSDEGSFDDIFFESLDEEDFLEGLGYYIKKAMPARQSAQDYKRDLIDFFEMLHTNYGIRNAVFFDNEISRKFEKSFKGVVQGLRAQENKRCISDEEFEVLDDEINKFVSTLGLEELTLEDIEKNYWRTEKKSKYYSRFVSVLPIKLTMKYALGNKAMANLLIDDLDLREKKLKVNGFNISLDSEMLNLFELYMKMREKIVELNDVETEFLFIKMDGSSFLLNNPKNPDSVDAAGFFFMMDLSIKTKAAKKLSYRKIIELVQKGADVDTLSQLVDVTSKTIKKLCQIDGQSSKENLQNMLAESNKALERKYIVKTKGMIQCPFCGKVKEALAENWVLIQVEGKKEIYLSCKDCEGRDGKYRY